MRHEKVIKDERGTVRIAIKLVINTLNKFDYVDFVYVTPVDGIEEDYKPLAATPSEILEAKLELWEKIKPC